MADRNAHGAERPTLAPTLRRALLATAAVGGAALLYVIGGSLFKPAMPYREQMGVAGASGGFVGSAAAATTVPPLHTIPPLAPAGSGAPAPALGFQDAAGHTVKLTDFKGRVLVVNLWATWCAPCRKEMPTLARLAKEMRGRPVAVVALSIDNLPATAAARAFIAQNAPLAFYQDAAMTVPFKLVPPVTGFPTTLIYDKAGRLRATARSDLDWAGSRAMAVIGKLAVE